MARTNMGCDADPVNLVLGGVKGALADFNGMCLATEISDVLFGTPKPTVTAANLGVLKVDAVNIALHGHNPLLSEVVCDIALLMEDQVRRAGEKGGINIVGVCCTGNEVMVRHGVPLATNYLSQELAAAVANRLGVDLDSLPLVASAPEAMSEKAVAIGTWNVALGIPTHLGTMPQISGSPLVTELLTETAKQLLGGYFVVEPDPDQAADKLLTIIDERRKSLGI